MMSNDYDCELRYISVLLSVLLNNSHTTIYYFVRTMFFKDPSGNNLEFKAMTKIENLFAKYNVVDE